MNRVMLVCRMVDAYGSSSQFPELCRAFPLRRESRVDTLFLSQGTRAHNGLHNWKYVSTTTSTIHSTRYLYKSCVPKSPLRVHINPKFNPGVGSGVAWNIFMRYSSSIIAVNSPTCGIASTSLCSEWCGVKIDRRLLYSNVVEASPKRPIAHVYTSWQLLW